MHLDIIHEKAIDLFVAGKRQCQVAAELNVTARTVRRWCEDEAFSKALSTQHRITRNLELGDRLQVGRDRRDIHRKTMEQIQALLNNTDAPIPLRALCLKPGMQDAQFDQRQFEAQEWRESVQAARVEERRANQAAHMELMKASNALNRSEKFLEAITIPRIAGVPPAGIPVRNEPENRTKADKGGNSTPKPAVSPAPSESASVETVDKSGAAIRNPGVPPGVTGSPGNSGSDARPASAAPNPIEKPVKSGQYRPGKPKPWQKPPNVPFYQKLNRRR
jgi:hypothetical protein